MSFMLNNSIRVELITPSTHIGVVVKKRVDRTFPEQ